MDGTRKLLIKSSVLGPGCAAVIYDLSEIANMLRDTLAHIYLWGIDAVADTREYSSHEDSGLFKIPKDNAAYQALAQHFGETRNELFACHFGYAKIFVGTKQYVLGDALQIPANFSGRSGRIQEAVILDGSKRMRIFCTSSATEARVIAFSPDDGWGRDNIGINLKLVGERLLAPVKYVQVIGVPSQSTVMSSLAQNERLVVTCFQSEVQIAKRLFNENCPAVFIEDITYSVNNTFTTIEPTAVYAIRNKTKQDARVLIFASSDSQFASTSYKVSSHRI